MGELAGTLETFEVVLPGELRVAEAMVSMPASLLERFVRAVERLEGLGKEDSGPQIVDCLLTKQQVAKRLGGKCSLSRVDRLMKAGKLKPVPNMGKRTVRFRPADVERFLADRETQPGRRRL